MSRKDYRAAAVLLLEHFPDHEERRRVAAMLVEFFRSDNTRFDAGRFYDAAEVSPTAVRRNPPGKFETSGRYGEVLHLLALDGTDEDMECPDGWYGLMLDITKDEVINAAREGMDLRGGVKPEHFFQRYPLHVIVCEDSAGFFTYEQFDNRKDAEEAWEELESECAYEGEDEGEG
jgi:hypothetical protein